MKEKALRSGNGNLFRNGVSVGGKMHLTTTRIHHIPHAMNLNRKQTEIDLLDVAAVNLISHRIMNFIPIPNGLEVVLQDDASLKFVVNGRRRWKREIERAVEEMEREKR
ncbi:hypothetical protein FO441_00130 [Salinicoccus cyprini]|uniref:GRAM domain-containing protein n=1 Tax=Salinicoccus cyprini TaxID=2493691 RepID=A0A558AWU0_9STAP|nr:hypothetical protein [Salinicoccus cyprini]TVT28723.1 hypothetical protein FO441_00130 [Salinicoccus cyprini]